MGAARVTFWDSTSSHPQQLNQNLWDVQPRQLAFKCFLSSSNEQASLGSPDVSCLPS